MRCHCKEAETGGTVVGCGGSLVSEEEFHVGMYICINIGRNWVSRDDLQHLHTTQ